MKIEIGYITLHLMGAIERLHTSLHKKIVLIYPFGQAGYDYIVKKINHIHDLEIEICCQLSMFDAFQIKEYQPDLVISFVHIEEKVGYPIYVCHNLLLEEDIENIYNILKGNHTFKKNVFFEKELFHIYNDIERVDFETVIDWKERDVLVKTAFPVEINASEATYEIQYGNVTRPTHNNTSWEVAAFEVCGHKWLIFQKEILEFHY